MKIAQTLLVLFYGLLYSWNAMAQITVVEPGFEIINTFGVPANLTAALGTMLFSADGNTVYILDTVEDVDSAMWSATVTRNAQGNVTGFGTFTQVFAYPNMDTGLEFGPGTGTYFFRIASGGIGQRLTNGTVETTAVTPYSDSFGGLGFIPASYTSGGDIVSVSYIDGTLYLHAVTPDGDGSFTVTGAGTLYADFSTSIGASILGDIIFVTSGLLAGNALLATYEDVDSVVYFPLGADGLPAGGTTPTPQVFTTGDAGAWGLAIDPVTNNIWVIDFDDTDGVSLTQIGESALELDKTADVATYTNVGDQINYEYLVTSSGAIFVAGPITVADDKETVTCPAVNTIGNNDDNLDPDESITCTASHTVVQGDINDGLITNMATASGGGVDSNEDEVTVNHLPLATTTTTTSTTTTTTSTTTTTIPTTAMLRLEKTWSGAFEDDAISASTDGLSINAMLMSTSSSTGDNTTTGAAVQVFVGESPLLLAEQFTTGTEDNYITSDWECDDVAGTEVKPGDPLEIMAADAGNTITCTVTNTSVFFEGIPVLNRYGLALLALLMLGIGIIGFRRFS